MVDGNEYSGRSYAAVVEAMSGDKLTEPRSRDTYRRATARRVRDMYGVEVDDTSDRTFVRGLVQVGLMKRLG